MSTDTHNEREPHRAPREKDSASADDTVQISNAELAAIRQSASNPEITPEILSEMDRRRWREENRQRAETPHRAAAIDREVADDDATKSFDRRRINAMLQQGAPPEPGEKPSRGVDDAPDQDKIDTGVADGALADAVIAQAKLDAEKTAIEDPPATVEVTLNDTPEPAGLIEISDLPADEFASLTEDDIYDAVFGAQQDDAETSHDALDALDNFSPAQEEAQQLDEAQQQEETQEHKEEPAPSYTRPDPANEPIAPAAAPPAGEELRQVEAEVEPAGPVDEPAAAFEQVEPQKPQAHELLAEAHDAAKPAEADAFERAETRSLAKILALIGLLSFIGGTLRFVAPTPLAMMSETLATGLVAAGAAMVLAAIVLPRR